jgi:hypothetical protein
MSTVRCTREFQNLPHPTIEHSIIDYNDVGRCGNWNAVSISRIVWTCDAPRACGGAIPVR